VPSCHETGQPQEQSHDTQECECHRDFAAFFEKPFSGVDLGPSFIFVFNDDIFDVNFPAPGNHLAFSSSLPLPFPSSVIPLYIQNSVLRI
jgi:hypothetical protein